MRGISLPQVGVLLFLVLAGCGRTREAYVWAVDRGAEELVVLDQELLPLRRIPAHAPALLVFSGDAPWVASRFPGADSAPGRLERIPCGNEDGVVPFAESFGEILDLVGAGGEGVVLLERSGQRVFLWRVEARRGRHLLGTFPQARRVALQPGELLVGSADGQLARLDVGGALLAWGQREPPVRALAPGPRPGQWWVLCGDAPSGAGPRAHDGTRIELLDRNLEPLWSARTSIPARSLASVAGVERIWLAGGDQVCRLGPGGVLELEFQEAGGPWTVSGASVRGVLLWSAGAVLQVDVLGRSARVKVAQGGFRALTGLVAVRSLNVRAGAMPPPGGSCRPERAPGRAPE